MIKRYYATKDNTITNSYRENFTTTGKDANMGASDILEVFSIYGQVRDENNNYSLEESRILIEFDISQIKDDIENEVIHPDAQFYLRLFNAEHGRTLPFGFDLEVSPITTPWEEGTGLDMESYKDLTYGNGSSWNTANSTFIKATATFYTPAGDPNVELTATSTGRSINDKFLQLDVLPDAGTEYIAEFKVHGSLDGTLVEITQPTLLPDGRITTAEFAELINTGGIAGKTITVIDPDNLRSLYTATGGGTAALEHPFPPDLSTAQFSGGEGEWATAGGDYDETQAVSAFFDEGTEDLVINVTSFVSNWLSDPSSNAGLMIKLPDSTTSEQRSYYTKMFYARGTSNFFKKPLLEARWKSQLTDHRKTFLSGQTNDIYLYNEVRGELSSLGNVTVSIYEELGGTPILADAPATEDKTGIYVASIAPTTSSSVLYDVWYNDGVEVAQGSITVLQQAPSTTPSVSDLVVSVLNNQDVHYSGQTSRFYFYIREKDWSPSIYTVATSRPDSKVYDKLIYKISKVVTDEIIFDYDMTDEATTLSYDSNGNFFDLDISMLEPNYVYEIKLALFNVMTKSYQELPFKHRFRVVNNEH